MTLGFEGSPGPVELVEFNRTPDLSFVGGSACFVSMCSSVDFSHGQEASTIEWMVR